MVQALSQALGRAIEPLTQKLDLLSTQLASQPQVQPTIPQRRGVHTPPPGMLTAPVDPNKPMSIREFALRSTVTPK
jgi:hypothetical protein